MYSTRLDNKEYRYLPTCIINETDVTILDTYFDTGAKYTCYYAKDINNKLCEDDFKDVSCLFLNGFTDEAVCLKFYPYKVTQFVLGNVSLENQTIWVTFDKHITDNVVGMDIISKVTFLQYGNKKELHLFKDEHELKNYVDTLVDTLIDTPVDAVSYHKYFTYGCGVYYINYDDKLVYFNSRDIMNDTGGKYITLGSHKCYLIE